METQTNTTIDPEEIERFSRIASEWWLPEGKFKPLHQINPLRIQWILEQVASGKWQVTSKENNQNLPLATCHLPLHGKAVLDIGCGGGLISEPMCRLGAKVTGIDASEKNIKVAALHAQQQGLDIEYRCMSAESLVDSRKSIVEGTNNYRLTTIDGYDIVLALEIIEHVADSPAFVTACCQLVKPGGIIIWSTLNRTPKSYALAILGAEYILRWLPRGTHHWHKFVKPSELHAHLRHNGMEVTAMTGMTMNPLTFKWLLTKNDVSVNYLLAARKG